MTPSARLQSAIELLDAIIVAARDGGASADQLAKRFFAERRYAGSKDRRAVRELAWSAIRRFGERPDTARAAFAAMADHDAELAALFDEASDPHHAYRVELSVGGGTRRLEWHTEEDGQAVVHLLEPASSQWLKLWRAVLGTLIPEHLL